MINERNELENVNRKTEKTKFNLLGGLWRKLTTNPFKKDNKSPPLAPLTTDTAQNKHQAKCFIAVAESAPREGYKIERLLKGGENEFLKEYPDFFERDVHLYLFNAVIASFNLGKGRGSVYILYMGYNKEEIKKISEQGRFNEAIIQAVDCKDLNRARSLFKDDGEILSDQIPIISNPNFNPEIATNCSFHH